MSLKKAMLYFVFLLVVIVVFWHLVMYRKINPDKYFIKKIEPISFSHINVQDYKGGISITPELEEDYRSNSNGNAQYSINYSYSLYDNDYSFHIENQKFTIHETKTNRSFVLGTIVEKRHSEYDQTDIYKVKIKESYKAIHEYAKGIFPYYVKVQFTMMTSGGNKYSTEVKSTITSPSGEYLKLYFNNGYIKTDEKTGIGN